ncbi:MAG: PAS domain-containing protein [Planctomycetia bacterium]|nr:PAS domain-containing protein [Planctomycetia bacterium]
MATRRDFRSQQTSPSRRRFWARACGVFLLLAGSIGCVATVLFLQQLKTARLVAETNERNHVGLQAGMITTDFAAVLSDLRVLTETLALKDFLATGASADQGRLAAELQRFLESKSNYSQLRFLNERGNEIVRVSTGGGRTAVVPKALWRAQAGPQYIERAYELAAGQTFVSPFDLDFELSVEGKPQPTIRFAAPVFDRDGDKRGIVVLNYAGAALLDSLKQASLSSAGRTMLLNADGYWLFGGDDADWAFMYPDRNQESFAQKYPQAWPVVLGGDRGQVTTREGLITYRSLQPFQVDGLTVRLLAPHDLRTVPLRTGYVWKVLTVVPTSELPGGTQQMRSRLGLLYAGLLPVLAGLSWIIARYREDRERAIDELRINEERFRQLAENIDEVFWMIDLPDGKLSYVGPALERIWGIAPLALTEQRREWPPQVHPEDAAAVRAALDKIPDRGGFELEYRIVRGDGSVRWIRDRGFAVRDASGKPYRVAGLAEDITDQRDRQQRELQTQRLAAIGEAMTGLAHESRNALQRSQAGLEMLAKRVKDKPDAEAILGEIQQSQRHLHRLYEEVRGYAVPIRPEREPCDLGELVHDVWEQLAVARVGRDDQLLDRRNGQSLVCNVDHFSMGQVIRNILENSIGAADPAVVTVAYEPIDSHGQAALRLRFHDNGPGLDAQQLERIFEPFFTTKSRGTGLGMAISKRIVEAHGGTIAVHNSTSGGAEVTLTLPRGNV